MRRRIVTFAAIVAAASLTTNLESHFTLLGVLGWAIFFTGLLWPWALGRSEALQCRLPWSTSSGA